MSLFETKAQRLRRLQLARLSCSWDRIDAIEGMIRETRASDQDVWPLF